MAGMTTLRIVSWNVNGLRACAKRGFRDWLDASKAEIVGVQEVRARPQDLPAEVAAPEGWFAAFSPAARAGYSGVGLYARRPPDALETSLGRPDLDAEGRVQIARFGGLALANVYFPNGSGKDRDNARVPFKLDFYRALHARVEALRAEGARVLVMGDFNTAHREIDLARPRENRQTSGFLPEECDELDRWLRSGLVDTFRRFESGPGHYSWWSQRFGVRARNVGWRIDYVLACPGAMKHVRAAWLSPETEGSDHCPVGVEVDARILGRRRRPR
jgi:exodeoxyribonuclease-3